MSKPMFNMSKENCEVADNLVEVLEKIQKLNKTRESSIAFTKIEEGLMWFIKHDANEQMDKRNSANIERGTNGH